ncbi:hypothetical protein [Campylobacter mucosalis]|uniref:Uncharacterized protein n=1 Tax=Campylobacter mucosalis CCUG 21559 TaxID=1032067 RepID=A0A6G5QEM3_9BACT|nr:hypothetical protein [Campylobacter mucosalis]QCD44130.1 hypothetical protein CMUC_0316 [Campylobacter mucosalis CCUG 21559]QCD44719.1 hypothetical protein CMUC_0930 [Campylobacter mucosalis CCUG 21559]
MDISFNESYQNRVKELLRISVDENTPFQETIKYLEDKFTEYLIPNDYRIKILSNILPQMTLQFTTIAMQVAMELTEKDLSFNITLENLKKQGLAMDANIEGIREQTRGQQIKNDEIDEQRADKLANLKKQGQLLDAQIKKLGTEDKLALAQQKAIDEQVKDNRLIKSIGVVGGFISDNQAGGMIVPTDMTKYFFNLTHRLISKDVTGVVEPTNMTMTKKT